MSRISLRSICCIAAILGFVIAFSGDADAKTNFARKHEKAAPQETKTETAVAPDHHSPPSCSPSKKSLPKGIGSLVNGFFAFGCKINYGLTDWVLSDKCDPAHARRH
ncbi:MAG: hypothetical protein HQ583_10895, partial [Candidatus Abyssubacteria bacterium]|nr:hypothetical protein [Candidatus Abyssubacteria bacterium]